MRVPAPAVIRATGDRLPWLAMTKPPLTPRLAWSRAAAITQCRRVAISESYCVAPTPD